MIIKIDYSNPKHTTYFKVDEKNKLYYKDNTWSALTLTQSQLADIKSGNTIVFDGGKASLTDRFMSGGSTMQKRTKLGLSRDKMYKALGEGERTSKKVSTIRMSDGSSFKRRNANQYGMAEGGNDYTEKRPNRSDKFDNGGGTGVSSQTGYAEGTNAELLMNKDYLAYKNGGGVGDDYTVTLETFEIDMPKFQTYLKSKNIKFKKHSNNVEVDYFGTYNSLKSMIDKYWAMDSDKDEKKEYYDLIEKGKMKTGGSVKGKDSRGEFGTFFYQILEDGIVREEKVVKGGYSKLVREMAEEEAMKFKSNAKVVIRKLGNKKYNNGGGTGVSSQTGYAEGTNAELLMNKDYLAYKNGGGLTKNQKETGFENAEEHADYIEHLIENRAVGVEQYDNLLNADNRKYQGIIEGFSEKLNKSQDEIEKEKNLYEKYWNKKYADGGGVDNYTDIDELYKKLKTSPNFKKVEMHKNEEGDDYIYILSKLKGQGYLHKNDLDEFVVDYVDAEGWYGLTYEPSGNTFDIKNINDIYEITRAFENVEENKMSEGGLTKGFEYTIGGL